MKLVRLIILGLVITGVTAGCLRFGRSKTPPSAGVYRSQSKGERWEARHRLVTPGGVGSLAGITVSAVFTDSQDSQAMYLSVPGGGLVYTFDAGATWTQAPGLSSGTVNAVAVDPRQTCVLYVALSNVLVKSVDCVRSFKEIYVDPRPNAVTSVAVDGVDSNVVYLGTSSGDFLRSVNGGTSWSRIRQFASGLSWLMPDPNNPRRMYALTAREGLFRADDSAQNWVSLAAGLAPYASGQGIRGLQFIADQPNTLLMLNRYGLLRSGTAGDSWEALSLITPPLATEILAFAVNPKNSQEVYYATASTFYSSLDGGVNWVTRRLPARQALPRLMFIHPRDPLTLYLALEVVPAR